jgi:hypothetical protein
MSKPLEHLFSRTDLRIEEQRHFSGAEANLSVSEKQVYLGQSRYPVALKKSARWHGLLCFALGRQL